MSSLGAASSFVTSSADFGASSFLDSSTLGVATSGLVSSAFTSFAVSTLAVAPFSSALGDTTATPGTFPLTAVSEADTAPFPRNINPAAIATEAAPKLYLRIP